MIWTTVSSVKVNKNSCSSILPTKHTSILKISDAERYHNPMISEAQGPVCLRMQILGVCC